MLGAALGVLAEVVALRRIIPAERALGLRWEGILLALGNLLLAVVLVVVIEAVLGVRRVVGREIGRGGAEGTAGLLLARGLRGLSVALEAALELVLRGRGDGRLLGERLEGLRGRERRRLLGGGGLTEAAELLGVLRSGWLHGGWSVGD